MSTNRRISFSNDFPKLFLPAFFGYRRRVLARFPFLDFFQGKYRQPHVGICINRFPFLHLVKSLSSDVAVRDHFVVRNTQRPERFRQIITPSNRPMLGVFNRFAFHGM